MPSQRTPGTALTPKARHAYDNYAPIFGHLVRLATELASAPLADLTTANKHMERTGTRYSVTAMRHLTLNEDDIAALRSHREFFALLARFAAEYRQFRTETAAGDPAAPDTDPAT